MTRIRDIGRVEVGAADYGSTAYMDRSNATTLRHLRPAGRQLARGRTRSPGDAMEELKKDFPPGVDYISSTIRRSSSRKSIHEVIVTIFVAILLVVGVVFLFLQNWRATIIPVVAIPVSLVGTFAILAALGISLNNLSLFGLVLAVGIVVDDAIVVVENVERNMRSGMSPRGGGSPDDGRSRRRADLDRADAVRRVRSVRLSSPASPDCSSANSRSRSPPRRSSPALSR